MKLQDSTILQVTLSKLFPFAVLLSFSIFSYGAAFPGGGFQAGVVLGSFIVVYEIALNRPTRSTAFYNGVEIIGLIVLAAALTWGWIRTGSPFGAWPADLHTPQTTWGLIWNNPLKWLLSLGIFLEVTGSMVLIFRLFMHWQETEEPQREVSR
jgi:hypothetical protein